MSRVQKKPSNYVHLEQRVYHYTHPQWKRLLKGKKIAFVDNVDRVAQLMVEFCAGALFLWDTFFAKNVLPKSLPSLCLVRDSSSLLSSVMYSNGVIYIAMDFLRDYAEYDFAATYTITCTISGDKIFGGTIPLFFRLVGVEKCHHHLFRMFKGRFDSKGPNSTPLAEYDAQEIEYRALRWQYRQLFCMGHPLPWGTIKIYRERLKKASKLRFAR